MSVRLATPADAALLARLLRDFNAEFDTETDGLDVLTERFARLLGEEAAYAVVSGAGDGFGLITLRPVIWYDGPCATLDELYVVPARRDAGLGTALLAEAVAEARRRGCPELHINVDEVDADTRRFYERHGFVNVEREEDGRMLLYVGSTGAGD